MKKGIVYSCLAPNLGTQDRFKLAAEAGIEGVEVHGGVSADVFRELKDAADAAGIKIPSIMTSTHWSHPLSSADAATRQHTIDAVTSDIESAALVGAETVLVVPGVVNEETTYQEAWERSLAEFKKLAPIAEKHNVTIGIENVWNKFLLSPIEFNRFIDEIGSSHVKAYFDCGNILAYGFPQHWIRSLGERINRVHVKDFRMSDRNFVYLLEGNVPWAAVVAALREIDYTSYLTIELPPYPQCPEQMVFDSSNALTRIFSL